MDVSARRAGEPGRVLYWFRTPPGIRVGGMPLDEDARRLIESRHPEIRFDWRQILSGKPESGGALASTPPRALPSTRGANGPGRRRRRDRRASLPAPPSPADSAARLAALEPDPDVTVDERPESETPSHD